MGYHLFAPIAMSSVSMCLLVGVFCGHCPNFAGLSPPAEIFVHFGNSLLGALEL